MKRMSIVGAGKISWHHAEIISKFPNFSLSSIVSQGSENGKKLAEWFQVPFFDQLESMFLDTDIVVLNTPSGTHFELAQRCLRAGKSVILEKPPVLRLSHWDELVELGSGRIFPVFQNRFNRAVLRVKRAIRDGELGVVHEIRARVQWCRDQKYYDQAPWRGTFAMDGGALTNQGIHFLDLMRFLGGEVHAIRCHMSTEGAKIEVEDTAVGQMEFESAAHGEFEVTTAIRPADRGAILEIDGEEGRAVLGGVACNELLEFSPDPGACKKFSEDFSDLPYGRGHELLYLSLSQGTSYPISLKDTRKTLQLLHAGYVSAEEDRRVEIQEERESSRLGLAKASSGNSLDTN